MAGYTRQSIADIINGANITAPPINAEFNQLVSAFNGTTGHAHDGSTGNAPKIELSTSVAGYLLPVNGGVGGLNNTTATTNPLITSDVNSGYAPGSVWLNTSTGRLYICVVNTANAAVWVEALGVQEENRIVPHANDTVDIGTSVYKFQDLFLSGTANANAFSGASLTLTGGATVGGNASVTGNITGSGNLTITGTGYFGGNLTANDDLTVNGATTLNGNTDIGSDATDTVTVNATIDSNLVPNGATRDLGTSSSEWRNLYIDGTAEIDQLNADSVDIDAGTIDGTAIGSNTPSTVAATTITSSGGITGNLTGDVTGNLTGDVTGNVTGVLTGNVSGNITSTGTSNFSNAVVTGGTINGTTIGSTTAQTVRGTTITATTGFTGNLTGNVTGNVTGNLVGDVTGDVTGNVSGNITSTGTSTFESVTINGELNMNSSSSATIINLTDPTNNQDAATKNYVDTQISNLLDGAPAALDTLNELAAALNDDANAYTTLNNAINTKVSKAGDTMTGTLAMGSNKVTSSATPSANSDLTNKLYVDTQRDTRLATAGGSMTGAIAMGTNKITGLGDPTVAQDAVTKSYVDTTFESAETAATKAQEAADSATAAALSEANASASETAASSSETAASASATLAQNWAIKTDGTVDGTNYSAKYWATQSDVGVIANNIGDINNVAGSVTEVEQVSGSISDVEIVASDLTSGNFVAGAIYDFGAITSPVSGTSGAPTGFIVTAVNNLSDIQLVATNISDVTNFADVYIGPKSSAPSTRNDSSALQGGDLYFDTSTNVLRYYNGTSWLDLDTPEGDMADQDASSVAITGGTVQGVTITNSTIENDIDFGSTA